MITRLYREDLGLIVELSEQRVSMHEMARMLGVKRHRVRYLRERLGCQALRPGHRVGLQELIPELLAYRRLTTAELIAEIHAEWGSVTDRTIFRALAELVKKRVIERVCSMDRYNGYYRLRDARTSLGTKR